MIGVTGQYVVKFSVANKNDFLTEDNFRSLIMQEEAGNYLPTFQLSFMLQDDEIFSYLNEGNNLKLSFGRDLSLLYDIGLNITKLTTKRVGDARYVSLLGIFSALQYVNQSRFIITESVSSTEAIRQRAALYFPSVNIQATPSGDSMRWICPGWTDKKFINEIWMHSNIQGSFPAVGISTDGRFILKDVKKSLSNIYDWKITKDLRDLDKDIAYNNDAEQEVNSGFINSWMGYGRKQTIYNLEAGTSEDIEAIPEPVVALTNKISRNASIEAKYAASNIINENMHSNYWRANLNNLTSLATFGTNNVTFSYSNKFYPMRVLDSLMYKDDDIQGLRSASSEFNSGLYMVSKIVRVIMNRSLRTTAVMCRESLNQVR